MEDTVRGATRFWRLLPLLYLAQAAFLLVFLSFPANIVPAVVFLVLGLGQWSMGKFLVGESYPQLPANQYREIYRY